MMQFLRSKRHCLLTGITQVHILTWVLFILKKGW